MKRMSKVFWAALALDVGVSAWIGWKIATARTRPWAVKVKR
jgi:hypothetical protein